MNAELIEKENIEVDQIIAADELLSEELLNKLAHTSRLGNEFKGKVTLTFNTKEGAKKVYDMNDRQARGIIKQTQKIVSEQELVDETALPVSQMEMREQLMAIRRASKR